VDVDVDFNVDFNVVAWNGDVIVNARHDGIMGRRTTARLENLIFLLIMVKK